MQRMKNEVVADLFCGSGGASSGIARALGRPVTFAVNHCPHAIESHAANHPETIHLQEDVFSVDVTKYVGNKPFGILWGSPSCTHHSRAKGGAPLDAGIRGLDDAVIKMAAKGLPRLVFVENVVEWQSNGPLGDDGRPIKALAGTHFTAWVGKMRALGYQVEWKALNAADYGAPTSRERLFLIARRDGRPIRWPAPSHAKDGAGGLPQWKDAAHHVIDWAVPCRSIFGRKKDLADNTLKRIARGLQKFVIDSPDPFVVSIDNTGKGAVGGVRGIQEPISTITSKARHALVVPFISKMYGTSTGTDLKAPLSTITSGGNHHGLVVPFIAKHYTGVTGQDVRKVLGTVTTRDHHSLVEARMGDRQPDHVKAFLLKFYGTATGQKLTKPLDVVTTKGRFGLVQASFSVDQIVDIGFRMLTPRELSNAQGFDPEYKLIGTQEKQVARIGNSVAPPVAEALVRANMD